MPEELSPVLRVADGHETAKWYQRLGFTVEGEHCFAPGMPLYMFLRRGPNSLHLSEHTGDARPNTLVYFSVTNLDEVAAEFGATVEQMPWGRNIELTDPDGNRWRIGECRE